MRTFKNYCIIALMLLMAWASKAQEGFRFGETEFFGISVSIDPGASMDYKNVLEAEKGLHIAADIEYVGFLYTKVGVTSFAQLTGGYKDIHAAIGPNFTSGRYEKFRYYAGGRMDVVFRNGGYKVNPGIEIGIDYKFTNNLFVGLRADRMTRYDQELLNWKVEEAYSGYVRVGYRWNWIPKNQRKQNCKCR